MLQNKSLSIATSCPYQPAFRRLSSVVGVKDPHNSDRRTVQFFENHEMIDRDMQEILVCDSQYFETRIQFCNERWRVGNARIYQFIIVSPTYVSRRITSPKTLELEFTNVKQFIESHIVPSNWNLQRRQTRKRQQWRWMIDWLIYQIIIKAVEGYFVFVFQATERKVTT